MCINSGYGKKLEFKNIQIWKEMKLTELVPPILENSIRNPSKSGVEWGWGALQNGVWWRVGCLHSISWETFKLLANHAKARLLCHPKQPPYLSSNSGPHFQCSRMNVSGWYNGTQPLRVRS